MDKTNIIKTRIGGLGSSDAKMVATVGKTGQLNETAKKRIAQMLGLIERDQVSTHAMQKGNEIEDAIFESIKQAYPQAVSNPFYKSETLSEKYGLDVFNHIDIEVETDNFIAWIEIKATIDTIEDTFKKYSDQLAWHWLILTLNSEKIPQLKLFHYDTSDGKNEFDSEKITSKEIKDEDLRSEVGFILKGLQIISDAIPNFKYEVAESESNLPAEINQFLPVLANFLRQSKEYEQKADELKLRLKNAMFENSIKSIDNDFFKCTFTPETVQSRFDSTQFKKDYPELYAKYLKNSNVSSQIRITLKD